MHYPGLMSFGFAMLFGLASPGAAAAGPPQAPLPATAAERAAVAEALFAHGKRLMLAGRFSEACSKFVESERLDHGVGTLLNLADCYEQNGQTASAWAEFRTAAAAANTAGQAERERIARERERRLLPLLARLTISIPRAHVVPGLVVMRDDLLFDKPLWGMPIPVDPGDHTVVVSAPGKRTYTRLIKVPKWSGAWVSTTVPALADLPSPPPEAPVKAAPEPGMGAQKIAGIALGSAGSAGVIIGGALGVLAISKNNTSASHCRGDLCDPEGVSLRSEALRAGTASTVVVIVAGAALAGGAALYFTAPKLGQVRASATIAVLPSESHFFLETTW